MIAVLIIDMQNAFFEDPALNAQRGTVTAACNRVIAAAQECGAKVLLVRTEHEKDKSTWTLNMLDDDQGFMLRLRNWDVETVVLARISTHDCIAQTGADAFAHNIRVIYAAEATASENAEAAAVQDILCREYRQQILGAAEIQGLLEAQRREQEVLR